MDGYNIPIVHKIYILYNDKDIDQTQKCFQIYVIVDTIYKHCYMVTSASVSSYWRMVFLIKILNINNLVYNVHLLQYTCLFIHSYI